MRNGHDQILTIIRMISLSQRPHPLSLTDYDQFGLIHSKDHGTVINH
jgi:hypothetical protein